MACSLGSFWQRPPRREDREQTLEMFPWLSLVLGWGELGSFITYSADIQMLCWPTRLALNRCRENWPRRCTQSTQAASEVRKASWRRLWFS